MYRNNLRKYRLVKGLTLKRLAQRTGYRYSYLIRLEKGLSKGTPNTWIRLARELEISVTDFFNESKVEYQYKVRVNEQERLQ